MFGLFYIQTGQIMDRGKIQFTSKCQDGAMREPGFEPGLLRWQRNVLTTVLLARLLTFIRINALKT